ncbi:unnamed protein product, partial [Scytosiphon promiscuus]
MGCSPRPRSTRQAALLMRGAVRSLVRFALLSAWRKWRQVELTPRPASQSKLSAPGDGSVSRREMRRRGRGGKMADNAAGEGCREGDRAEWEVEGPAAATAAAAAEEKEAMWKERQALLLSFAPDSGKEHSEGAEGPEERGSTFFAGGVSATGDDPAAAATTAAGGTVGAAEQGEERTAASSSGDDACGGVVVLR